MTRENRIVGRRNVLKSLGVGSVAALAGCMAPSSELQQSSGGGGGGPDPVADDTDNPLTDHPYTAPPEIVNLADQGYESTLRTVPSRHALLTDDAAGGPIELPEVWAWQADDHDPSVPGPIYRIEEGETFELHYENTEDNRPHTVHMHAVDKSWQDDGAPVATGDYVGADESQTYEYEANVPGTHVYHCHYQTHNHLDMGMYGILRVDPEDYEPPDREYFLTFREWDSRLHHQNAGGNTSYDPMNRSPHYFTMNGRAAPTTFHPEQGSPIIVSEGDTVNIHLVNGGYDSHTIHLHGHRFTVTEKDGSPISEEAQHEEDVRSIAAAERYTIEFEADSDPGIYPLHCHKVHHVTNDGSYPGGMATAIVYEEIMDTEEFQAVMDMAGFDG